MRDLIRTKWAAVGAAVAVTLGAGGVSLTQAAISDGERPVTVTVDTTRILDTRTGLGLAGGRFVDSTPQDLQVTGDVPIAPSGTATVVPTGALGVLVNVTVVAPDSKGFLSLRAGGATGTPATSTVNFEAGITTPNAATVDLSGDGKLQIWLETDNDGGTAHVLVDIVGYTTDHNHDDRYYTEAEVDTAIAGIHQPIAYGYVNAGGSLQGGHGVVSAVWEPGAMRYSIDLDESYFFSDFTTSVTSICEDHSTRYGSVGGNLLVYVSNGTNDPAQCGFSFIVFRNPD